MKKLRVLCAVLLLALAVGLVPAAAEMALGQPLPDFTVTTIDGSEFTLSEVLKEKDAVLINLWATWCVWCTREFPYLEEAYQRYGDRVEVIALSVESGDTDEKMAAYAAENGLTFPIANESGLGLASAFAAQGVPVSLVVDRFGNVAFTSVGAQDSAEKFARVFEAFLGDDYTETRVYPDFNSLPPMRPSVEPASPEALSAALNAEGGSIAFRNPTDDMVWPMAVVEKDGRSALMSGNAGQAKTASTVYADVEAAEGDVLAFDFATSIYPAFDRLEVFVDGERAKVFTGEHGWTTWALPLAAGAHEIAFTYDNVAGAAGNALWLDEVRLLSGDDAAAALAALPVRPAGDAFALTVVNPGAKQIEFTGDEDGWLDEYFACDSYWIVGGDAAELEASLTADMDPDAALYTSNYDGSARPLFDCLDAEGRYRFSCAIHSAGTTGYPYTNVYLHRDLEGGDFCGVMLFGTDQDVESFINMVGRADGPSLTRVSDGTGRP